MYATKPRITFNGNYQYVYRVEHSKYNIGPYQRWTAMALKLNHILPAISAMRAEHCDNLYAWPDIYTDCRDYGFHEKFDNFSDFSQQNPNWHCGCESIDSIRSWFLDKHLKALGDVGFVVKVYRIHRHDIFRTRSGRQCAFVKPTFPNKILSIESIL